ncbi:MAG: FtsQ-type POTRA domain-containing protein [bacterium]
MRLLKFFLVLGLIIATLYYTGISDYLFKRLSYFNVNKIVVSGNNYIEEKEILSRVKVTLGENIFNIDLSSINNQLKKNNWIKEAIAKRDLPDAILLLITERLPIAYIEQDNKEYLVDQEGYLMEAVSRKKYDYPVIKVITLKKITVGEYIEKDIFEPVVRILKVLQNLSNSPLPKINKIVIKVREVGIKPEITITAIDGISIKVEESNLRDQMGRLEQIWNDLRNDADRTNYIDLRYEDKVIINML